MASIPARVSISVLLCIAVATSVLPVTNGQFPDMTFIQNPGHQARLVGADSFGDSRLLWLFPFLPLSRSGNITGWVFRVELPLHAAWNSSSVPLFELWRENKFTPQVVDYDFINGSIVRSVQLRDMSNPSVYEQTLTSPLQVGAQDGYILGIRLPIPGASSLNMTFHHRTVDQSDRPQSYYSSEYENNFIDTTKGDVYRDDTHVPLVSPVFAEVTTPEVSVEPHPSSSPSPVPVESSTAGTLEETVLPPLSASMDPPFFSPTPDPPTLATHPGSSGSKTPPIAIIIGTVITALVLVTLAVVGLVLLLKYRRMRFARRKTHLDNPTYQVPENGIHTGKSTSSNGSYHAYATPIPPFLSATLPPLSTHQISPHVPPPLVLHHYEVDEHRDSHVYDLPGLKAATMPLPVPYEVPMAPTREVSTTKHHVYSELECGEFPSVPTTTASSVVQEDKKSLISSSQSSSIFDNSIYRDPSNLVPSADGALSGSDDLYWKPASSTVLLYDQLSHRKFQEILREDIKLTEHLGSGQFGTVNKGTWQSPGGSVLVAVKQLQLKAAELDRVRFLQEAAIMGQFFHPNVVTLHGVVTKDDPIMIVLEYMPNGDLRNSLLNISPLPHEPVPANLSLLLLRFCQEVAAGMAYLAKKAFVHRDLAARNILLDSNSTCKIGDFGMSRDLEDSDYYITHGGIIPVKWTAPEALHYKKFSTASDVWSFGCLMYEIWSLGHKPFEQYGNMDCIQMVSQGFRLPPPPGCCRALYKLMILCWHTVPSQRPVFPEMQHVLTHLDTQLLEQVETQSDRLGGPLEAGEGLYTDLQDYYLQEQTDSASDSR